MKTFLFLLFFALPSTANAKSVDRADALRQRVIQALNDDRDNLITLIETSDPSEATERYKVRLAADEKRIRELGGTFVPWVFRGDGPRLTITHDSAFTQDPAAAKIWRDGYPYPNAAQAAPASPK